MRLRKLTVVGFKSFADRTEFLFDDGVTCVVGPNGCGKSNVVDAVKWVLGEQSAKSLRGTEMLDVIFNGSSARKPSGLSEVTLEFDNDRGLLQMASGTSDEKPRIVSVTRRLYRSGESEYLINGQVARLRDIREMFMDTGVGTTAYSMIEQGKVAELLQSNPVDRRAIFEEAAGISKYKARKKEAIRKLERVEQNLLRLNDILAEVEKRLRSIKLQAGKARNYQSYSQRLKELRGLFSLAQYHKLREERRELQNRLESLTDMLTAANARIEQMESNRHGIDSEMADLERQGRQVDAEIASIDAQARSCQERVEMLSHRCRELEEQIASHGSRDRELQQRIGQAQQSITQNEQELGTVELQIRQCAEQVEAMMEEQQSGQLELTRFQAEMEDEKAAAIDVMRRTSQLHNEITASGVRRESLAKQKDSLANRAAQLAAQAKTLSADRETYSTKLEQVRQVIAEKTAQLEQAKAQGLSAAKHEAALDAEISTAKENRSSLAGRRNTLEEMQRQGQGISDGVKRVLAAKAKGQLAFVRGILADFVSTDLEHAAVVEAALAGREQNVVAERSADLLSGRSEMEAVLKGASAEVLCLDRLDDFSDPLELAQSPVAARRVIDMVTCEARVLPAVLRVLGKTLAVDTLAEASLAAASAPQGYRFVTGDGAVVEADGRVRLGRPDGASGMISRRSELEHLAAELEKLSARIEELTGQRQVAKQQRAQLDEVQQQLRTAVYEANTERVEFEGRLNRLREQLAQVEREQPVLARDMETIAQEMEESLRKEEVARQKAAELEAQAAQRQQRIEALNAQVAASKARLDHLVSQLTERRVQHAQASEQRNRIRESLVRLRRSIEQMNSERQEAMAQVEADRGRLASAQESIAAALASAEQAKAQRAQLEQQAADVEQSRAGLVERAEQIRAELASHRRKQEETTAAAGKLRVDIGEADVRVENLITRCSDELGLDLIPQYAEYQHDTQQDWNAVNTEIQDLRGKIERLGNVNLDAIAEQEELEQREKFLGEQLADINNSKSQLTELIGKINKQSRDMFVTTFEAVRQNFQTIFRKLFGGGKADILLADPEDVLECGIEIIARPPGKELRNITLLSGGEKTMATVALLFSIFRAKPSPFCILDEVDAALDEANNERFNLMIREFLDQSQFIVITHSKRTMSVGNVLYGVTMQEPGVSRRVSVKFEEAAEMAEQEPAAAGA